MAALPSRPGPRRPRPGSLARPVSGRLYRGTWLLVGMPLLLAAFTVGKPQPLRPAEPPLPAPFNGPAATQLAREIARSFPDRVPGSQGARETARWLEAQLAPYGYRLRRDRFRATLPDVGRVRLENLVAVSPGRAPDAIVVMAHRDNAGLSPGANDNASGLAALVELARANAGTLSAPEGGRGRALAPTHTLVFVATDGGAFGGLGAERFARRYRGRLLAVLNLDAIGSAGRPRLVVAGSDPRSPAASLVETAAQRVRTETGRRPDRARALAQLIDLGFPFSLHEQASFVARGIPAVTLTTTAERPPSTLEDRPDDLNGTRLGQIGRASQGVLASLDQSAELAQGTASYVYLGARFVRGWAIELVLVAALLPFLIATVDLFARCRRRRVPLGPAFRSLRSRLAFWLWTVLLFQLFALVGAWHAGISLPAPPESSAAGDWPVLALIGFVALSGLGWLVARDRLLPRRHVSRVDELAGTTAALLALAVLSLLVVATNPFALLFLLPSAHAWLWLPHVRGSSPAVRVAVLAAGFAGPLLLVGSFATRYGLGLDAPWYVAQLAAIGYVGLPGLVIAAGWLAVAGQLAAVAAGRYAPYPSAAERPRLGPIRAIIRRGALAARARRRAPESEREALET